MIDIGNKTITARRAVAQGTILVGRQAFEKIETKQIPKGCPKILAEISGINGAKNAAQLIPLCHPLSLDTVQIKVKSNQAEASYTVTCMVKTHAKTGVEMEALAGVNSALLTMYDLIKIVEPALEIRNVYLLSKEGGKQGFWTHPNNKVEEKLDTKPIVVDWSAFTLGIITLSDRAYSGVYRDLSTDKIKNKISPTHIKLLATQLIPDEPEQLIAAVKQLVAQRADWIITTGGTGIGSRDITYCTLKALCEQEIPGIAEKLRQESANYTPYAWISRMFAGIYQRTLITALPGNPKAINQLFPSLEVLIAHTLTTLKK